MDLQAKTRLLTNFGAERRYYWRIADTNNRHDWELIYHKNNLATPWQIKRHDTKQWTPLNMKQIEAELSKRKVDVSAFESQLVGNILAAVVYYNEAINEVSNVLGRDKVDSAIEQHTTFSKELLQVIRELQENPVKDDVPTAPILRLLPND